jgi:hypothetical protein
MKYPVSPLNRRDCIPHSLHMRSPLHRFLEMLIVPLAAAVVFFEQVLIGMLNTVTAALARWAPIAALEAWLKRQPPWVALVAFVTPSILILPIKFSAIFFAAHHRYLMAIAAVVIGKMLATAILARLYVVLRPTLMTIDWFARLDTWFFFWRDRAYAYVRSLPAWQKAMALIEPVRRRLVELFSGLFAR